MNWGTCSRIGRRQAALSAAASVLVRALPAKAEPKPAWTALPPTPGRPAGAIQHVLRLRDTTLAVWELGAGPPVVMLHGGMANADWWAHQAIALARTHRVLSIDTRGHGRSPLPPGRFGYGIFAADTVAVMDALSIPRAHIGGWSDGASAACSVSDAASNAMKRPHRLR